MQQQRDSHVHTLTEAIHICCTAHHPPSDSLRFGYACMFVCAFMCVPSESSNARRTAVLTQVFGPLSLSIGTLTDTRLVTLGWKTRDAHAGSTRSDSEEGWSPHRYSSLNLKHAWLQVQIVRFVMWSHSMQNNIEAWPDRQNILDK